MYVVQQKGHQLDQNVIVMHQIVLLVVKTYLGCSLFLPATMHFEPVVITYTYMVWCNFYDLLLFMSCQNLCHPSRSVLVSISGRVLTQARVSKRGSGYQLVQSWCSLQLLWKGSFLSRLQCRLLPPSPEWMVNYLQSFLFLMIWSFLW